MGVGFKFWYIRRVSWNRIASVEDRLTRDIYSNRQNRLDPGTWGHWHKTQAGSGDLSLMEHSKKEFR